MRRATTRCRTLSRCGWATITRPERLQVGRRRRSLVADNDLAIGRLVEAVSHSKFWDDTAFFILEDDAQNGADHVDAHRSLAIVVSKYAPHAKAGQAAVVDSGFYSTVSVLRTMEALEGVPPMNNNDALAPVIGSLFAGDGDQAAYEAGLFKPR